MIIPTFNRERLIKRTLESIEEQSFRDFEIILIDDGSTDETVSIVKQFSSVCLIEQQNSGPGSARNSGAREARGDYLAFLDSDDIWFPWSLKCYHQMISSHQHPAIITGSPVIFEHESDIIDITQQPLLTRVYSDYYSSADQWLWYGVSSFVIRRDLFWKAGGFTQRAINGEDAELMMRLGVAEGFVHVDQPFTFAYRSHGGNITTDMEKNLDGLRLLIEQENNGEFPGGTQRYPERMRIISRHIRPIVHSLAKQGRIASFLEFYRAILSEAVLRLRGKFLVGAPVLLAFSLVKQLFTHQSHDYSSVN